MVIKCKMLDKAGHTRGLQPSDSRETHRRVNAGCLQCWVEAPCRSLEGHTERVGSDSINCILHSVE